MTLLQLFLPYRHDSELKPAGFESYTLFYHEGIVSFSDGSVQTVKSVVDANRAKFEVDDPQLEKAQDLARILGDNDAWGDLCPELQVEHLESLAERKQQQQEEIVEDQLQDGQENVPDLAHDKKIATFEKRRVALTRAEGLSLLRSLNETQIFLQGQRMVHAENHGEKSCTYAYACYWWCRDWEKSPD